jgi:diguanylate cyclase (GGDEF)-like protein
MRSVIFLVTLFKYELFELLPFAYYSVFEAADYPIMILNNSLCLVRANSMAQSVFGEMIGGRSYLPLNEVFGSYPNLESELIENEERLLIVQVHQETQYFTARLSSLVSQNNSTNGSFGYLLMFSNETSHINQVQNLEIAASVDPLTGSYNRRYFYGIAELTLDRAKREGAPLAIIMMDIDHFKETNDKYGHQAGDYVLQSLTAIIKEQLRNGDVLARYGGEEFVVLLPLTKPSSAGSIAERICSAIRGTEFTFYGQTIDLTISAGIGGAEHLASSNINDYIALADNALYQAKEAGRNRVCVLLEKESSA